jgi:hypothetical protein
MDALINAWGRWDAGRLLADVVWTMRTSGTRATTSIMVERPGPAAPGLPAEEPALDGHVKSVVGDDVVIYKTEKMRSGSSMFARSTKVEEAFRLSAETSFFRKRILRGGQEVYVLPGSRDDLAARASIQVWGRVQDGRLEAAVVCVNVFK